MTAFEIDFRIGNFSSEKLKQNKQKKLFRMLEKTTENPIQKDQFYSEKNQTDISNDKILFSAKQYLSIIILLLL